MENKFDIFISYRRLDEQGNISGRDQARLIAKQLQLEGYRAFFDYSEIRDDEFDKVIIPAVENCKVFILVLTKDALNRCANNNDWVRKEIETALSSGCKIVNVTPDNTFNGWPLNLPSSLERIKNIHIADIQFGQLFEVSIKKLIEDRISHVIPKESEENLFGSEIHFDVDTDCELYLFKTYKQILKANENNIIFLRPGKYLFDFIPLQTPKIKYSLKYELASDITCDFVQVKLKDAVEEVIARREEEASYSERLKRFKNKTLHLIKKDEKYGYADELGNVAVYCKWDDAMTSFHEGMAAVKDSKGNWGFIDKAGKVIIPCNWKEVLAFYEGLAAVRNDYGEWGYVDKANNIIIPFKWKDASIFMEGLACVKDRDNKYGYIDKTGKIIIPCKWKNGHWFSEGLAAIQDANNKWGYIDKSGYMAIPCQWDLAYEFQGGKAKVFDKKKSFLRIDKIGKVIEEN